MVALFPLLLLAVDLWVQEGRRWPLALSACVNLLTNYVFFVGEVVFLAVYYLVRWLIPDVRRAAPPAGLCGAGGLGRDHGGGAVCAVGVVPAQQPAHPAARRLAAVLQRRIAVSGAQYAASGLQYAQPGCADGKPLGFLRAVAAYGRAGSGGDLLLRGQKRDWLRRLFLLCLLATLSPALNGAFLLWTQSGYRRWFYMLLLLARWRRPVLDVPEAYPVRRGLWIGLAGTTAFQAAMLLLPDAVRRPGLFAWNCFVADAAPSGAAVGAPGGRRVRGRAALAFTMAFCVLSTGTCARLYHDDRRTDGTRYAAQLKAASQLTVPEGNRVRPAENRQALPGMLMNANTFCSTVNGGIFELNELLGTPRVVQSELSGEGRAELLSAGYTVQEQPLGGQQPQERGPCRRGGLLRLSRQDHPAHRVCLPYLYDAEPVAADRPGASVPGHAAHPGGAGRGCRRWRGCFAPRPAAGRGSTCRKTRRIWWPSGGRGEQDLHPDERGFCSEITCAQAGYGFYSFSWDAGWSAMVNGEPVEILNICGLMAVPLQAGENRVEFRTPPGLRLGLALTRAGWAVFAVQTVQEVLQARRKRRKARGSAGEEPAAEEIGGRNRPAGLTLPLTPAVQNV